MSKLVPDDEIWAKRTERAKQAGIGAWSAKQLAAWGVPWPPPKGWRRKLNGGVYRALDDEPVESDVADKPIRIEFERPISGLTLRSEYFAEMALRVLADSGVAVKAAEPEFQDIVTEVLSELEAPWD